MDSRFPRLLGDFGGTHARLAWQSDAQAAPSRVATLRCDAFDSLHRAISAYLAEQGGEPPVAAALGIANPISGDRVQMTNHHWSFSISELQQSLGLQRLLVLNDFTALAMSLPALSAADLRPVGGGQAVPGAAVAVLGPGTGLGVSGLIGQRPITGEGGHVSLAAADETETRLLAWLLQRFGHASAERALSGPGLVNLYQAVCALGGQPAEALTPPELIARALAGQDTACVKALEHFCNLLGGVAGNLALTLGARGGVYIGGGIVPRVLPVLQASAFRERFEAKGRFRDYLAAIPIWVIDRAVSPALLGAGRALDLGLDLDQGSSFSATSMRDTML